VKIQIKINMARILPYWF